MNTSSRDRILLLTLPSGLVLMFYVLFFARPVWDRQARIDNDLAVARAKAPPLAQIRTVTAQVAELDRELADLRKLQTELDARWKVLAASCLDPDRRHDRLARIVALLGRHHLHLLEQAPADGGGGSARTAPRLSLALDRLAKRIQATSPTRQPPQTWALHLVGTYSDMMHALRELGTGDPLAIPVGISMEEVLHTTTLREWRLWLWI